MADSIDLISKLNVPTIIDYQEKAPEKIKNKEILPEMSAKENTVKNSAAPHLTVAALNAIKNLIGGENAWHSSEKSSSKDFFQSLTQYSNEAKRLNPDLVSAIAEKGSVENINSFLEKKGFSSLKLQKPNNPEAISSASIMDIKLSWETPGIKTMLRLTKEKLSVPAAHIKNVANFFKSKKHAEPIVELKTSSNEKFFLTKFYETLDSKDSFAVIKKAQEFTDDKEKIVLKDFPDGAIVPMANYSNSGNISEIIGATTTDSKGNVISISNAIFAHHFRLNEKGAEAKAANVITALAEAPHTLNIDGPYLAWIEVDNGIIPFAVLIQPEDMKDPDLQ